MELALKGVGPWSQRPDSEGHPPVWRHQLFHSEVMAVELLCRGIEIGEVDADLHAGRRGDRSRCEPVVLERQGDLDLLRRSGLAAGRRNNCGGGEGDEGKALFHANCLAAIDNRSQVRICEWLSTKGETIMKHLSIALLLSLAAGLAWTSARADPRLDEKVYSPYVERGVGEIEVRTAGQNGRQTGGDATTVIETEYGLSDRISLAVLGSVERSPEQRAHFTSIGLEAVGYIGQIPKLGVDTGAYLEYKRGLNDEADVAEAKLLLAKTANRFQGLLNLIVEHPLGPKDEAFGSYGYAASATWRTAGTLRLGAEVFGNIGNDHRWPEKLGAYVGPQILWEGRPFHAPIEIGVDAGYLFPVGAYGGEASSQLRFGIELERRF